MFIKLIKQSNFLSDLLSYLWIKCYKFNSYQDSFIFLTNVPKQRTQKHTNMLNKKIKI